jgi:hypothetical protein
VGFSPPRRVYDGGLKPTLLITALLCLGAGSAQDNAAELTGLFMQSCIRFAGNPPDLRTWAVGLGLHELPPQGEQAFLNGQPGKVFDATNEVGKRVVVSGDSGACSAVGETADGEAVVADLEQALRDNGIAFRLTQERDDSAEKALHQRSYLASKDTLQWQILVGTVLDKPGTAMLTALP